MKRHAPATERNREPLAQVLAEELPASGLLLEIAAGTGQHAAYFAARLPGIDWLPSDPDREALESIAAWREEADLPNLRSPIALDAAAKDWPIAHADAILCVNMVHISPVEASEGLLAGAGRILPKHAPLVLYGPFLEQGIPPALSNLQFDESLRQRNPQWGLRSLEWVDELALKNGLERARRVAMPANNLTIVYRKL